MFHVLKKWEFKSKKQRKTGHSLLFCTKITGIFALLPMLGLLEVQHCLHRWYCLCTTSDTDFTVLVLVLFHFCLLWVFCLFLFCLFGLVFVVAVGLLGFFVCLFWGFMGGLAFWFWFFLCVFLLLFLFLKLITQLPLKTGFRRDLEITSDLKAEGASKREKELLESRSSAMLGA